MPMPRKTDPEKKCKSCGTKLSRKRFDGRLEDRTAFLRRKYCDQACMARGYVKDAPSDSALLKRVTKYRATSCEACGSLKHLGAHHIDQNLRNDSPENIQTLCASCHTTHHHRARRAGLTVAGRMASLASLQA